MQRQQHILRVKGPASTSTAKAFQNERHTSMLRQQTCKYLGLAKAYLARTRTTARGQRLQAANVAAARRAAAAAPRLLRVDLLDLLFLVFVLHCTFTACCVLLQGAIVTLCDAEVDILEFNYKQGQSLKVVTYKRTGDLVRHSVAFEVQHTHNKKALAQHS